MLDRTQELSGDVENDRKENFREKEKAEMKYTEALFRLQGQMVTDNLRKAGRSRRCEGWRKV